MTKPEIFPIITSKILSQLKERARKLKRSSGISHHEALNTVAHQIGQSHWKKIVQAHALVSNCEEAINAGTVVIMDTRWALEQYEIYNDEFPMQEDGLLEGLLEQPLFNYASNFVDFHADGNEHRPLKEYLSNDEIAEFAHDVFTGVYFKLPKSLWPISPDKVLDRMPVDVRVHCVLLFHKGEGFDPDTGLNQSQWNQEYVDKRDKLYSVNVHGVPTDKVHPTLRVSSIPDKPNPHVLGVSHKISLSGRLAQKAKNVAWFSTYEQAEDFLAYVRPKLDSRGWGNYQTEIVYERANQWALKAFDDQATERKAVLESPIPTVRPKATAKPGMFAIKVTGVSFRELGGKVSVGDGFVTKASAKKGGFGFSQRIQDCKRYASAKTAQRAIDKIFIKNTGDISFSVYPLTKEEHEAIEDANQAFWEMLKY